ncbi:hypothetical protein [Streptomyces yangpuensis]|uniref:hypothetical protein n=1 Tax=Streptomyces yangpuensis TaxID=1648182 RepID=UPI003717D3E2
MQREVRRRTPARPQTYDGLRDAGVGMPGKVADFLRTTEPADFVNVNWFDFGH